MNYTQTQLKQAYQIVTEDLFDCLLKARDEQTVRLGNLGKFTKNEQIVRSKKYGQHVYYKLTFSCFSKLKEAFHNQLRRKYRLSK